MLCVFPCIAEGHEPSLVVVTALLGALVTFIALSLYAGAAYAERWPVRLRRLTAAALLMAGAAWATHFVATRAFKPIVPLNDDIGLMILSTFVVLSATWLGLALALWRPRLATHGGAIVGGVASAMHHVGLAAMLIPAGVVLWDEVYVGVSIGIGMVLGAGALWIAVRSRKLTHRSLGAALLAFGVLGLKFTAVSAASMAPAPRITSNYAAIGVEHRRAAQPAVAFAERRILALAHRLAA